MSDPKQDADVRRLFFAEHFKIGTIAAELSLHPDVIKRIISAERFVRSSKVPEFPSLEPYKDFIKVTLEQYPRLRATRLVAMLKDRGYSGGVHSVRRFVKIVRPLPKREVFFRLEALPGEQGQVDWAHFGKIPIGNHKRTLSCFVMILGHSRGMFARFFLDQTLENFLRGHVEAFAALGGSPRNILYDNLKSVVLDRVGDHIRFNPRFLELAGHYHFAPKPCAPYRGNEKGKVERTIHYLRYSFFEGRHFRSLGDLNAQLREWIDSVAHARTLPGESLSVKERLSAEQPRLLPAPQQPFVCESAVAVVAKKTPYIRFDLNDYSIPPDRVARPLTLIASETRVRILDGLFEVANHQRSYERARRIEDKEHFLALEAQKRRARELRGRHRLIDACPSANSLLAAAATRGESLSHLTLGLLRLLDRFCDARALDQAIAATVERGATSLASIEHILDQERRRQQRPVPLGPLALKDERAAALRTQPHSLADYDALSKPAADEVES
jgi:transposase